MERIDFIAAHKKMSLFLERFRSSNSKMNLWQRASFRFAITAINDNFLHLLYKKYPLPIRQRMSGLNSP